MKKILVSLLAIAMLFAFTACNNENGEPAAQITNAKELADFAAQTGDFEGKTNAKLSGTITLENTVSFTKPGLTLGAEDGAKIVAGETGGTESEPVTLLSIDADKITFNDVVIEATGTQCTYAVAINANDFTYNRGSITGEYNDTNADTKYEYSSVNMGIAVAAGTTGTTVNGTTLKACWSPVYSSSADVELTNLVYESGIEFEVADAEKTVVKGCTQLTEGKTYDASFNVMTTYDTTEEVAKAVLDAFLKNNEGLKARLDGTAYPAEEA